MSASIAEQSAVTDAAKINIPGRLERLPMTSYQKRMFTIVATAWLADQVDVALLVFLIGALKEYFNLTPVEIGYLASMTFLGQLVGNLLIGSISDIYGRRIAFQSTMILWGLASFLSAWESAVKRRSRKRSYRRLSLQRYAPNISHLWRAFGPSVS
jgi:putative MFS transporter